MIFTSATPSIGEFERVSGWEIKPQGACKDDRCVPLPPRQNDCIDLADFAARLGMPIVHDASAKLWALGPESGGRALRSAQAPSLVLPDIHGNPFHLDSLRGQKVLLVAWASW
jgi:hypothetical protein